MARRLDGLGKAEEEERLRNDHGLEFGDIDGLVRCVDGSAWVLRSHEQDLGARRDLHDGRHQWNAPALAGLACFAPICLAKRPPRRGVCRTLGL